MTERLLATMGELRSIARGITRTPTSLGLPGGLTFAQWERIGRPLLVAGYGLNWWIGDWLNYGANRYTVDLAAVAKRSTFGLVNLNQSGWVAAAVRPAVRRAGLSWTHHRIVAPLDEASQIRMLARAEREQWTTTAMRKEVRELQPPVGKATGGRRLMTLRIVAPLDQPGLTADEVRAALAEVVELVSAALARTFTSKGISAKVKVR